MPLPLIAGFLLLLRPIVWLLKVAADLAAVTEVVDWVKRTFFKKKHAHKHHAQRHIPTHKS